MPTVSAKPEAPRGEEIVVANAPDASDLVVTERDLYWAQNGEEIVWAPNEIGATSRRLCETLMPETLIVRGDLLVWTAEMNRIFTMPRTGGTPATLATLSDSPWSIIDADGLVVGAYEPGKASRVVRISDSGEVAELAKVAGEAPVVSRGPDGQLFVATITFGKDEGVAGPLVDGRVEAIQGVRGGKQITIDADAVYVLVPEGNRVALVKVMKDGDARAPVRLAEGHFNDLALDDRYIYWVDRLKPITTDPGHLFRLAKAGGTPERLPVELDANAKLVVFGPYLYWADGRRNVIARLRR